MTGREENWEQWKKLNCSSCRRRTWGCGKKRETQEGRWAEKCLAREERGTEEGSRGRFEKGKDSDLNSCLWSDTYRRKNGSWGCWGSLPVTCAGQLPFATSLGDLSEELIIIFKTRENLIFVSFIFITMLTRHWGYRALIEIIELPARKKKSKNLYSKIRPCFVIPLKQ